MSHPRLNLFQKLFVLMTVMVVLLTLLVGSIGTVTVIRYVKGETLSSAREKLEQKKYLLEYTLSHIERTAEALSLDNNFQRYVLLPADVHERYPVWKDIVDRMNDTMNSLSMIDSAYLYPLDREKAVLTDKGVMGRTVFFDRSFMLSLDKDDHNRWHETRRYDRVTLSFMKEPPLVLSYVKSVPAQNSTPKGLLVINVSVESLSPILQPSSRDDRVTLMNGEGMILMDSKWEGTGKVLDRFKELSGSFRNRDYHEARSLGKLELIVRSGSGKTEGNFYYFSHDPYTEPLSLLLKGVFLLTLIFFLAGLAVSYLIARRYTKPWESLVREFAPSAKGDEFLSLSGTIRSLKERNLRYEEKEDIKKKGYIVEACQKSILSLENKLDRWKRGVILWEAEKLQEETKTLIGEIGGGDFLDSYRFLLLHETARFLLVQFWKSGGNTRKLFGDNNRILLNMDNLESFDEKGDYLIFLVSSIKSFLDRNARHPREELIENLTSYLEEHYREELYTESMARHLGLSESYFCRIIKESTGRTFNDILGEIRFGECCRLLRETGETLDQIAQLTGLGSKRNLLRLFKKHSLDTPGQYRQKYRLK